MAVGGWDVFVSYGHEDADWVRVLAANLHRTGFDVFLDEWELVGGDRVTGRLEEGIRNSASGVLVVSPHSLSRPWVREEYEALLWHAVQRPEQRRLIPVLYVDAELPEFLANRLWVDFRGAGTTGPVYEARLGELARSLQGLPGSGPARQGWWRAVAGGSGKAGFPAGGGVAGGDGCVGGGGVAGGLGGAGGRAAAGAAAVDGRCGRGAGVAAGASGPGGGPGRK